MRRVIAGKYALASEIGSGSFGTIYRGLNIITHQPVAIKFEFADSTRPNLSLEARIYSLLKGAVGFPEMLFYGSQGDLNVMVIDLLGRSLQSLIETAPPRFSLKTVLMLADQMIARLRYLHSKGIIHRDVKPENFVMGTGPSSNVVYLIDFGLAKKFSSEETVRGERRFVGTAMFASLHAHEGLEQGRRDDMEGLAYTLIWLLKGSLPWGNLTGLNTEDKLQRTYELKRSTPIKDLCFGIPPEFGEFLRASRELGFADVPDYSGYQQMFRDLMMRREYVCDYVYDWCGHKRLMVMSLTTDMMRERSASQSEGLRRLRDNRQSEEKERPRPNVNMRKIIDRVNLQRLKVGEHQMRAQAVGKEPVQ